MAVCKKSRLQPVYPEPCALSCALPCAVPCAPLRTAIVRPKRTAIVRYLVRTLALVALCAPTGF